MTAKAKAHFLKHKNKYTGLFIVTLVILAIVIAYTRGYRFTDSFTLAKVGELSITVPLSGTTIYIDIAEETKTTKNNETVNITLSPQTHSVILAHAGYYPWTKKFRIESEKKIELYPFFVSTNASGVIITNTDPEYGKIKYDIATKETPTKAKPKISKDGKVLLYLEDNAIVARTGSTTISVIQPDTIIRNLDFYKNRSDAVIFSTSNAIYAMEIDKTGGQNFMPIYKGVFPSFIQPAPNYLYVEDGTSLLQVGI